MFTDMGEPPEGQIMGGSWKRPWAAAGIHRLPPSQQPGPPKATPKHPRPSGERWPGLPCPAVWSRCWGALALVTPCSWLAVVGKGSLELVSVMAF